MTRILTIDSRHEFSIPPGLSILTHLSPLHDYLGEVAVESVGVFSHINWLNKFIVQVANMARIAWTRIPAVLLSTRFSRG